MNKITTGLVGVGLSALMLSGCATGPAAGTEGVETTSDAQRVESATEAPATEEMSEEEALAFDELAKLQEPLSVAVGAIEEQFPNEFAYTFFEEATLHVGFKAAAPEDAVALLEATGGSYVVIEEAGFNTVEYQAAMDSVSEQTGKYVTEERSVTVAQDPTLAPGAIVVQFHAEDKQLTKDPGLVDALDVDAPFRVIFDFTETSPIGAFEVFEVE
jgi:hypothetical protein